jgi:hypothetical protein
MRTAVQSAAPTTTAAPQYLQMKTRIGPVDDPLEREADRVADAVVAGQSFGAITGTMSVSAQRKCAHCEEEEGNIQRKCAHCAATGLDIGSRASSAARAVSQGGAPLTAEQRAYFEPRFGRTFAGVRIHTGAEAAKAARDINARAYTVGSNIALAAGEQNVDGRLLAHELTHVVQQHKASPLVQRQPKDAGEIEMPAEWAFADPAKRTWRRYARELATKDAARLRKAGVLSAADKAEINAKLEYFEGDAYKTYLGIIKPALLEFREEIQMDRMDFSAETAKSMKLAETIGDQWKAFDRQRAFEDYFDNNIKEVNYFTAELAQIHYRDGSMYRLGLVPRWMEPPVVEVDCHTPLEQFRHYEDPVSKTFGYMLDSELADAPHTMPYAELLKTYVHRVNNYAVPGNIANTAHIIPNRVNRRTTPTICKVLLDSERQYMENVDMAVQIGLGGVKAIGPYAGAGGWTKAPGIASKAAPLSRAILNPTARSLAREMESLVTQGGVKTVEVAGVRFTDVVVAKQGTNLAVKRFEIKKVAPDGMRGKLAAEAFEDAAVNVARSHGMKSVTINVGIFTNPVWREWMESMSYVFVQAEGAWIKTIKL